ncbi:MAG: hypothetical protein R3D34_13015 [Nitratireductor sp.]
MIPVSANAEPDKPVFVWVIPGNARFGPAVIVEGYTPGFNARLLGFAMLHVRVAFASFGERDGGMRLPEMATPRFARTALACRRSVLA